MAKLTRKNIIATIATSDETIALIATTNGVTTEDVQNVLSKWSDALSKASKSTSTNKNDEIIINEIVPFVVNNETPVTAKMVNEKFVHAERTNKASAMLRRAIELGLISRDRVRKNANYEYASPTFDWESYIAAYDAKVAEKAAKRIAKARANRS